MLTYDGSSPQLYEVDAYRRLGFWRGASGGGGAYSIHARPLSYDHRFPHNYNAGMEHVGFSPTRDISRAPAPSAEFRRGRRGGWDTGGRVKLFDWSISG